MSKAAAVTGPPFGSDVRRVVAGDGGLAIGWTALRASATHLTMQSTYLIVLLKKN